MPFTCTIPKNYYSIYKVYLNEGGNSKVLEAFRNFLSYLYIISEKDIDFNDIFGVIYISDVEIRSACYIRKMAMLKLLTYDEDILPDIREDLIKEFLTEALARNDYYSFYNRLSDDIKKEFMLYGISVVSRVDKLASSMSLYYKSGDQLSNREMQQPVAGYFSCPLSVIDVDETIKNRTMQLWKASINPRKERFKSDSRIDMVCDLTRKPEPGSSDKRKKDIYSYVGMSKYTFDNFKAL